jgi:hypothetical protein
LSYYWKGWSRCWCWTTVGNRACGVVVAAGVRAGLGGGIGGGRSEARAGDCLQVGVLKLLYQSFGCMWTASFMEKSSPSHQCESNYGDTSGLIQ